MTDKRQLPVIDDVRMFLASSGGTSNWKTKAELIEEIVTHCRDCESFMKFATGFDCTHCAGLKAPKQDGSSFCSFHSPKGT